MRLFQDRPVAWAPASSAREPTPVACPHRRLGPAQDSPGAGELVPGKGSIEFDSVVYSYATGSPVLKDVSFSCAGGQTLALVGATGMALASQIPVL